MYKIQLGFFINSTCIIYISTLKEKYNYKSYLFYRINNAAWMAAVFTAKRIIFIRYIYGLSSNAESVSSCIVSNGWMIRVKNRKGRGRKWS
jgi:hypothetical protein